MRGYLCFFLLICAVGSAAAQSPNPSSNGSAQAANTYTLTSPFYRMTLVQAAPGRFVELVDAYKSQFAALKASGEEEPLWMRHSQGDHWDLLIIYPIGHSYSEYYSDERTQRRFKAGRPRDGLIAWQEDWFCAGPQLDVLRAAFAEGGFFHVEMFQALPGSFDDLSHERAMENAYARQLHQPENLTFARDSGAAWDIVTIGVFRDLKHYAASADATPEQQQAAARAAGFESPAAIGPYLRRFIRTHHDTLAVAIK